MLWVKAFHIIFMTTWFAGLSIPYSRTPAILAGSGVSWRGPCPRRLPLVMLACRLPWRHEQPGGLHSSSELT